MRPEDIFAGCDMFFILGFACGLCGWKLREKIGGKDHGSASMLHHSEREFPEPPTRIDRGNAQEVGMDSNSK